MATERQQMRRVPQALGKLSAQAEEVGAANLGDLDGFAKDMTAEVCKLRQVRKRYAYFKLPPEASRLLLCAPSSHLLRISTLEPELRHAWCIPRFFSAGKCVRRV